MSFFIVRIELPGSPPETTYITLHEAMEKAGFSRTISYDGGRTSLWLPNAMYCRSADLTCEAVRNQAYNAAINTKLEPKVLVAQTVDCKSHGLIPA